MTSNPLGYVLPVAVLVIALIALSREPAMVLACIGLVTVSWDRVSVRMGGLTLKPAYVAFALALVVDLLLRKRKLQECSSSATRLQVVRGTVAGLLALLIIASLRSGFLLEGARYVVVVVLGAVVPAWICFRLGRSSSARREVLISWALIGAGLAAAVGIYQFAAGYLGLPSFFVYRATVGNLGRTAGLSYEPAFFAMYLVSLIPISVHLLLQHRGTSRAAPYFPRSVFFLLVVGVFLSNARAGYVALPVALLASLIGRTQGRTLRARPVILLGGVMAVVTLVSLVTNFGLIGFARSRLSSALDTQEVASNAPRVRLYAVETKIAADHIPLGIGPGALAYALPAYGLPLEGYFLGGPVEQSRVVANNIWLQAVLDCGFAGAVGVAGIIATLGWLARRCRDDEGRWLAFGCLLVFLVGGFLTSLFWDAKYWTIIGLVLAADLSPPVTAFEAYDDLPEIESRGASSRPT